MPTDKAKFTFEEGVYLAEGNTPLGRGRYGQVWAVRSPDGRVRRAAKVVERDYHALETEYAILQKLALLDSDGFVVRAYGIGQAPDGSPCLLMDLVEGQPLEALVPDPPTEWPSLFSVGLEFQGDLEQGVLSNGFRQESKNHGISLSDNFSITTIEEGTRWRIDDNDQAQTYIVIREGEALNICGWPLDYEKRRVRIATQIAKALYTAYSGRISLTDIKLDNFIWSEDWEQLIRVIDWNLVEDEHPREGFINRTAPRLAAALYELFTGLSIEPKPGEIDEDSLGTVPSTLSKPIWDSLTYETQAILYDLAHKRFTTDNPALELWKRWGSHQRFLEEHDSDELRELVYLDMATAGQRGYRVDTVLTACETLILENPEDQSLSERQRYWTLLRTRELLDEQLFKRAMCDLLEPLRRDPYDVLFGIQRVFARLGRDHKSQHLIIRSLLWSFDNAWHKQDYVQTIKTLESLERKIGDWQVPSEVLVKLQRLHPVLTFYDLVARFERVLSQEPVSITDAKKLEDYLINLERTMEPGVRVFLKGQKSEIWERWIDCSDMILAPQMPITDAIKMMKRVFDRSKRRPTTNAIAKKFLEMLPLADLITGLEKLQPTKTSAETRLDRAEAGLEAIHTRLGSTRDGFAQASEDLRRLLEQQEALSRKTDQEAEAIGAIWKNLRQTQAQLEPLPRLIEELASSIEPKDKSLKEAVGRLKDVDQDLRKAKTDLEKLRQKADRFSTDAWVEVGKFSKGQENLRGVEGALPEEQRKLSRVSGSIDRLRQKVKSAGEVFEEAQTRLTKVDDALPEAQKTLRRISEPVGELSDGVATCRETFTQAQEKLEEVDEALPGAQKTLSGVGESIGKLSAEVEAKEDALTESRAKLEELDQALPGAQKALSNVSRPIRDLSESAEEVYNDLTEIWNKIEFIKDQLARAQTELSKSGELGKQASEIQQYIAQFTGPKGLLTELNNIKGELNRARELSKEREPSFRTWLGNTALALSIAILLANTASVFYLGSQLRRLPTETLTPDLIAAVSVTDTPTAGQTPTEVSAPTQPAIPATDSTEPPTFTLVPSPSPPETSTPTPTNTSTPTPTNTSTPTPTNTSTPTPTVTPASAPSPTQAAIPTPKPAEPPMVADFGGLIGLVEAKVESSDPKLPAGSTIAGTLTWQLLEDKSPESKDYTASLQLQGSDNRVYYQKDIQIQDEGKGTSQLDKGTKITQTYAWDVDAQLEPGNYTLVVVVYNSYASNERLALQGGGTQKVLEEFVTAQ